MTSFEKMIDLLPYHLQNEVNNRIVLKIFAQIVDEVQEIIDQVSLINNVDAKGILLDYTGQIVNEKRNGETDEDYRQRIITKIIRMISQGDIETINGLGRVLLGQNYVGIFERWSYPKDPKNAAMMLVYNFSDVRKNPVSMFKTALAAGVNLDTRLQVYTYMFDFYEYGITNLAQFPMLINP